MTAARWRPCGDAAALAEVPDLAAAQRLLAAVEAARERGELPGVLDIVPAARTLLLRCTDAAALEHAAAHVAALPLDDPAAGATTPGVPPGGEPVRIPVVYDGEDLAEVARLLDVDAAEVVRRHTGTRWQVAFTGFAPGFGYLVAASGEAGPGSLAVPRRREPRTRVPAGAVGLAAEFTGVYPRASPGGWQLVGRTGTPVWRPDAEPPALLAPGVLVRFEEAR
ncbi:allophanate hydrolase subunit 1 [Nocardioides nanhaiensis]|uniref:Allophanate hydrolase subunit 1 n=1 Tax=Nocardioides nanhaiensis TaxID=1476871 RepID=A0ABP8VPL9_9ACTN